MEFWEGAILVVGGVWLVAHMARSNQQAQATVAGTSIMGSAGTSNDSNLTTITNTAGGYPSVYGEPLQPPQPPISPAPVPINYLGPPTPVARPIRPIATPYVLGSAPVHLGGPSSPVIPYRGIQAFPGGRPIGMLL